MTAAALVPLFQVVGFIFGYVEQSFWLTFLWCVGGLCVATLVCVPDWPFYRRHPLHWQTPQTLPGQTGPDGQIVKDTNVNCGTCACGASVHGINCESHPDNVKGAAAAATPVIPVTSEPADAAAEAAVTPRANAVEIQEIKVRSSSSTKKTKQ